MQLHTVATADFGRSAADLFAATLAAKPDAVIGLPTGDTPRPLYAELRARARSGWIPARLRVVMIDDFLASARAGRAVGTVGQVGATGSEIPKGGVPRQANDLAFDYYSWLRREVLDPLQVAPERLLRIPTAPGDINAACARFERDLQAWGGCDLLLLGLGWNGHFGFNEPGSPRDSRTRAVSLTLGTSERNAHYGKSAAPPSMGVTMGIATMLEARAIYLLVRGRGKAEMLRLALAPPPRAALPASWLQAAANAHVLADLDALSTVPHDAKGGYAAERGNFLA